MLESSFAVFKEYAELFLLNLKVKAINLIEYVRVAFNYYSNPSFFKIDASLLLSYLFHNPFGISKRFLLSKGERDIYVYGETPLTTMEVIARECRLSVADTVFELGCGRGRVCFWLNQFIGCSVVGIDFVPAFINRANQVKLNCQVRAIDFRLEDMFKADLTGATVIYLYGVCLSNSSVRLLAERLAKLPRGTKFITVSYALSSYCPAGGFEIVKRFPASFTWGTADVYLQIKT